MAKDTASLSKGIVVLSVLSLLVILSNAVFGLYSISFVGELTDSDTLVPYVFTKYLPVAVPFLVLAIFAAGMSTIDSQLLTMSSLITHDILASFGFHSEGKQLSKIIVLLLCIFLGGLALSPLANGAIVLLASKGIAIIFILFIPLLLALFSPHSNAIEVKGSILLGALTLAIFEIGGLLLPWGFGSAIAVLIVQIVFLRFVRVSFMSKNFFNSTNLIIL